MSTKPTHDVLHASTPQQPIGRSKARLARLALTPLPLHTPVRTFQLIHQFLHLEQQPYVGIAEDGGRGGSSVDTTSSSRSSDGCAAHCSMLLLLSYSAGFRARGEDELLHSVEGTEGGLVGGLGNTV